MLKKYIDNRNVFLLTTDISDFPSNFFDRKLVLNIDHQNQIQPIIFCQINKKAYKKSTDTY